LTAALDRLGREQTLHALFTFADAVKLCALAEVDRLKVQRVVERWLISRLVDFAVVMVSSKPLPTISR
jgi:hypothetical protein